MKITFVFFSLFAIFAVISAAKANKREAPKDSVQAQVHEAIEKAGKKQKRQEEEDLTHKKQQKAADPVDKVIAKQQHRLEKLNREAEMGRMPPHVPQEIPQDPENQPKLKIKTPKVLLSPEQYETFLKEKVAEKAERQVLKRQKLLLKAEQMINEIEMLDALECHKNSQAENFDLLVGGGSQQEAAAKCREPSEVLRTLKERVEALRVKEEAKKSEQSSELVAEQTA